MLILQKKIPGETIFNDEHDAIIFVLSQKIIKLLI